jgi:hypothetical protein
VGEGRRDAAVVALADGTDTTFPGELVEMMEVSGNVVSVPSPVSAIFETCSFVGNFPIVTKV